MTDKRANILFVEDDENLQRVIGGVLTKFGYDRVVVGTGEEAITALGKGPFQLAICDVYLPGISGLPLIQKLKAIQHDLKIILISGVGPSQVEVPIDSSYYLDWLIKPFSIHTLLKTIDSALDTVGP